jgi:hypothetical protein
MGGMGKLSTFGTPAPVEAAAEPKAAAVAPLPTEVKPQQQPQREKLATVNIKIRQDQRDWMDQTARLVRDNNNEPVPANERTYPQHLIQVAIDLLKATGVDWEQVRNVHDLKVLLNLLDD